MSTSRRRAIWAFTFLIAVAALAVDWTLVPMGPGLDEPSTWVWFVVLTLAFTFVQFTLVRLRLGSEAIGFSLMELPLVIGLYFCNPQLLVASRVLGTALAYSTVRRRTVQKAAFNCAISALEAAGATAIWWAITTGNDPLPLGPRGWLATGLALIFTSVVSAMLVAVVIFLSTGHAPDAQQSWGFHKLGEFASACIGLIAVYVMSVNKSAVWLLAVVIVVLWIAHNSWDQARIRAENLEQVNQFTEAVGGEGRLEAVVRQVLLGVSDAFYARRAELCLTCSYDEAACWVAEDGVVEHGAPELLDALGDVSELAFVDTRHLHEAQSARPEGRDGLVVPLRSEGRVLGCLLVAHPLGDAVSYKPEDLRQLQALANHAAVAIDNAVRADLIVRQAAEREHAALHDELTGLPNRRLFTQRVEEALTGAFASVLLIDLDSFRAVNDTLGHQVGDRLLELIAQRITDSAPEDAVVARLGGDEFAVLLPDAGDLSARACASMVRSAIAHTFDLDGLSVAVDAAVGVVVAEQGADAVTVLRHADLALYAAQESRSGTAVFEPSLDRNDSSRLGLLAALRHAVAGNQLEVHYQPQIDLPSGKVIGVEALARWRHPELGSIAPDEFVPLAEHSGLITPLTMLVLRTALRDVEQLQRKPGDFRVAVNISPRSLLDPGFVDEVARELARVALPASAVTLEITETSLMTDPEQAVDALNRLRSIGVRLSVDDLGTGYSSLAYLLKLPVDELKIDRSLVSTLPDEPAQVVVGAIADLGHRLGRHVVAEGIEDATTYDVVRRLGCDLAQGYYMGRPMPMEDLRTYLAERRNSRRGGLRQVL